MLVRLDETSIPETPPLVACYGHRGEQVEVPVRGQHARRVLHGALNIRSGAILFLLTETGDQQPHRALLEMIRRHWSGWHSVLFEDRGSPHTAATSRRCAKALDIEGRFLPRAPPELNAMDHLWRYGKGCLLANRATQTMDASAEAACQALLALSPHERLRKAGVRSGHFWLHQ